MGQIIPDSTKKSDVIVQPQVRESVKYNSVSYCMRALFTKEMMQISDQWTALERLNFKIYNI